MLKSKGEKSNLFKVFYKDGTEEYGGYQQIIPTKKGNYFCWKKWDFKRY